MRSLSTLVPHHERWAVRATADLLYREARDKSRVCRQVCSVVAAIAPELPLTRLAILVRYGVWSVVLDDRLDGVEVEPGPRARLREAIAAVVAGDRARDDPLLVDLAGILDDLSGCDSSGESVSRFGEALRDAVDSGIEHALLSRAVAAGERAPPSAERYLAVAARTANYLSFAYALLAVGTWPLTGAQVARVGPALGHGAYALRLSNDLRSVARDRTESTLNVLGLRTAAGAPVTPRYVQGEIDRRIRAHDKAIGERLGRGPPADILSRSLRLSVGLYLSTDLRPETSRLRRSLPAWAGASGGTRGAEPPA